VRVGRRSMTRSSQRCLRVLRRRFDGIGFKASYRAWDGHLFWGGDDGSHRFAALYQYCIEHDVAHYDAFRLIVREIDADRISAIQKDWSLFLAPPEIGRVISRAAPARRKLAPVKKLVTLHRFSSFTFPSGVAPMFKLYKLPFRHCARQVLIPIYLVSDFCGRRYLPLVALLCTTTLR
jgi:hypothetical protein